MGEVYIELPTAFTTADTVGPILMSFSGDKLTVTFANFRTPLHTVIFRNVRAFYWYGWESTSPEARPDRVYEVRDSEFLAPWTRFCVERTPFRHFKLGFNAEGKFLDVVATHLDHVPPAPQA
ncbi:MAG: hypothetical protein JNL39_07950 [Opitutaceae bacterium]|nr:hypothetical protein [Opitutaceae bacterium]